MHCILLFFFLGLIGVHSDSVFLDMYHTPDCSGIPNQTIDLLNSNETRCTQCYDRCAHDKSFSAYVLRGSGTAVVNDNCIGKYSYSGGWRDSSLGGTFTASSGCHKGGGSAVILCTATIERMQDDLLEICGLAPIPPDDPIPPSPFYILNPKNYSVELGSDIDWATLNIPFIDIPDTDIRKAYYYRWRSYKKHLKWTIADGWVVTEFLPYVPWSGLHNTIPAAAGHHIMEGRWLHDQRPLDTYIAFWYAEGRGDPSTYTNWIGHSAWHRYLVNGNETFIRSILSVLVDKYRKTYVKKYLRKYSGGSCWWQNDGSDAMEVSISGSGCRPTIAAAMFGEALAIVEIAHLIGNASIIDEFGEFRDMSRNIILKQHWNPNINSFAVIPISNKKENTILLNENRSLLADQCNLSAVRTLNQTVNVRELLAFMPWYYNTLIPIQDANKFLPMWEELFRPDGFASHWGLRTAEFRHPCYNYSYQHGDCWNGPSWPYETARVLSAMANVLNNYKPQKVVNNEQYWKLLQQYAQQHTQTIAINDTANPPHSGHIFENLHPDFGYWNNRARMYWQNQSTRDMGDDYNHSTFIDLVICGLLGIRPQKGNILVVNPLIPSSIDHFALDHLKYKKHLIAVIYDKTGTWYNQGSGLTVLVDGTLAAHSSILEQLTIKLSSK